METIEEQSKSSEMSISPIPSPENLRICLVGDVVNNAAVVEASHKLKIPLIISKDGGEIIDDYEWRTYFVLSEFEGPLYEAIHKNKQCILGPPALQHAAESEDGLTHNARPVYNYSMRGVVTCFTGIRKKDELTKLVNLIHAMGGCIRKDMNSKITHLICNHSGGDKYQYAKTFRLTVVRPAWVYAAWQHRDDIQFRATAEEFSKDHKLKAFEGQKICFFGFPVEERQHMVDILVSNGGVSSELDDPECTHVVMPNSGGYFLETITNNCNSTSITTTAIPYPNSNPNSMEVDVESAVEYCNVNTKEDDGDHFDERLVVDYERNNFIAQKQQNASSPLSDDLIVEEDNAADLNENASASTPNSSKNKENDVQEQKVEIDGIVLCDEMENQFHNPNNISPIYCGGAKVANADAQADKTSASSNAAAGNVNETAMEIDEITDNIDDYEDEHLKDLKRKRESFDSISLVSTDSFALPTSTKKPKLIRTGSITRSIRRSMSFVAVRTPIAKMLRPRRSSIALDAAPNCNDLNSISHNLNEANVSICSITSIETTFNDSIRKPVKEKLRSIRERITRSSSSSSSKKDKYIITGATATKTPEKVEIDDDATNTGGGFKTPKAPTSRNVTTPKICEAKSFTSNSLQSSRSKNSLHTTNYGVVEIKPSSSTSSLNTCNISTANFPFSTMTTNPTAFNIAATNASCNHELLNVATKAVSSNTIGITLHNMQHETNTNTTVVDDHNSQTKPEVKNNRTHILKSDWFWYTIQNGYADEMDYLFGDYLDSIANTPNTDRRDSLPISFNKRKRKRFSQRLQLDGTPLGSGKRRSSVSDAGLLSVSGSFFDCTTSPDKLESAGKLLNETETSTCEPQTTAKKASMRFHHFMDFFSTESNYVGILDTIVNLFKNPLEEIAETNDALLNKSEINLIFNNFVPIHEVHRSMLERLRSIQSRWTEDCLIGEIIIHHRDDLIKAYPPYVNFFEQMKETLQQCDTQNPRFHAFLKINQTKPECGRQSLQDLMIRPVQRLPSISLLLQDILKHTNKNNQDYLKLEQALKAIKEVMKHINEDKRRTESRMAIFDIFNDIEGCPPHLVSSNRSFILKCEVTELSDSLSGRGDALMLYLFSDTIEVCKKRSRGFNSAKSPSTIKCYKHVKLMSLNAILFVIDITDSPRAFAFLCRQEKEKLHSFTIVDEEIDKIVYLKTLCKQMAENACRTDTDKALLCRTSQELEVDISDVNVSTLSRAFKLAARTRLKVGRAFSFNKTPSKLKRAVSTMMTSPFGSQMSLTPSSQMAQMHLASCTNIHESVDEESMCSSSPSLQSQISLPQLSAKPKRKSNSSRVGTL